jgi:hypothetical protein
LLVNFIPTLSGYGLRIAAVVMDLYSAGALCFANFLPEAETVDAVSFKQKIIPLLVALPVIITAGASKADYDMFGVGLIFILYLANPENKITRTIVLAAGVIYQYGNNLITESGDFIDRVFVIAERSLNWFSLFNMLFALISVVLILLYNGKQGPKVKWAFYAFYPVHITVLLLVWYFTVGI